MCSYFWQFKLQHIGSNFCPRFWSFVFHGVLLEHPSFFSTYSKLFATVMQVKVLFLILMDLCRRTAGLLHPLPVSQVGSSNIQVRLHYIDGNYTVLPEVVEASLGPHMQVLLLLTNLVEDYCQQVTYALFWCLNWLVMLQTVSSSWYSKDQIKDILLGL